MNLVHTAFSQIQEHVQLVTVLGVTAAVGVKGAKEDVMLIRVVTQIMDVQAAKEMFAAIAIMHITESPVAGATRKGACIKVQQIHSINLELTQDCSLRCDYCFAGRKNTKTIDIETAKRAIDWLLSEEVSGNLRTVSVTFWGGEPMLKMDLIEQLVFYGREQGEKVGKTVNWGMTTNGIHLTKKNVILLKALGVDYMISLDGRPETQNRHRLLPNGSGSYDVIAKNIPTVLKYKPKTKVRASISADIAGEYDLEMIHLYELGFRYMASSEVYEGEWTEEQCKAYYDAIRRFGKWYEDKIRVNKQSVIKEYIDIKGFRDAFGSLLSGRYHSREGYLCGAGRGFLAVSVEGAIYPCHRFDVFDDKRAWQDKEWCIGHIDHGITRKDFRAEFLKKVDLMEAAGIECIECPRPSTGCYIVNLQKTKRIDEIPKLAIEITDVWREEATRIYNTFMADKDSLVQDRFAKHLRWLLGPDNVPKRLPAAIRTDATLAKDNVSEHVLQGIKLEAEVLKANNMFGIAEREALAHLIHKVDRMETMLEMLLDQHMTRTHCKCQGTL